MSETGTESEGGSGTAVVVGAGIGGLATAVGLRRAGWEVTVLERRTAPERYGTAFGIHPTAQGALDRLGWPPSRSNGFERRAGRPELLASRPDLIDALIAGLDRLGGARIAYGQRLADPAALDADLIVGADGINSVVRAAHFGGESGPHPIGTVAWIGIAGFETGLYGETWGAGGFFGMTPVEGRPPHQLVRHRPRGDHRPTGTGSLRRLARPIPRVPAGTDPATWIRCEMRHLYPALRTFVADGRIALVGGAAHAMTPNLGQGACTALLDAEALDRAVSSAGPAGPAGHAGLPGALRAYDTERRRSAQRVAFGSRKLHRFMTGRRPALRDALVRLLPKSWRKGWTTARRTGRRTAGGATPNQVGARQWRATGT